MQPWVMPIWASLAKLACRVSGSGVVSPPALSQPGAMMPKVPTEAALSPNPDQICRVKSAVEVLPLVPVTATMVAG